SSTCLSDTPTEFCCCATTQIGCNSGTCSSLSNGTLSVSWFRSGFSLANTFLACRSSHLFLRTLYPSRSLTPVHFAPFQSLAPVHFATSQITFEISQVHFNNFTVKNPKPPNRQHKRNNILRSSESITFSSFKFFYFFVYFNHT